MKKRNLFIQLLFMAGLLFMVFTACDKIDDTGGDFQGEGTVKDVDDNVYNTIKIGNQVWMVENLKTTKYNNGSEILNVTNDPQWSKLKTGAYCNYDNLENTVSTYGRIYNWYAVNTDKLAPAGWHVPTDDDWTILESYLIANGYNYDGTKDEDKIAQSLCAKTNWELSSEQGTPGVALKKNNSSGFTALPGGKRSTFDGAFNNIGETGSWWSSTAGDDGNAYNRGLSLWKTDLMRQCVGKGYGFSVRCVRD